MNEPRPSKAKMIRHTLVALLFLISAAMLLLIALVFTYEKIQKYRQAAKEKDSPYVIYIPDERKHSDGHYVRCLERIDAKHKYDDQGNLLVQSAALERVANSCN